MSRRQGHDHSFLREQPGFQRRQGTRHARDAERDLVVLEGLDLRSRFQLAQLHDGTRETGAELVQQAGQDDHRGRGHEPDADEPCFAPLGHPRIGNRLGGRLQRGLGPRSKRHPGGSQLHAPLAPLEEPDPELLFQHAYLLTECRLGEIRSHSAALVKCIRSATARKERS